MSAIVWSRCWIGLLILATLPLHVEAADAPSPEELLAWRLDSISSGTLGPNKPEAVWRLSAALLDAAGRLNPREPRFPRLRSLALMQIGDASGALAALKVYRDLAPGDRAAQVRLIELYASGLETLDAKVSYLTSLLDKQNLAPEVRAQIAVDVTLLLAQKSPELAAEMAGRAVRLYPLAPATRQYYERVGRHKPLKERVAALLTVLRADPNQPIYMGEMADLLAQNGLADPSLQWYDWALNFIAADGPARPTWFHDLVIDYVSEMFIAGHAAPADTLLGQMLDAQPLDADGWFLKLTASRMSAEDVAYGQTVELARNALVRRWNMLHDDILEGRSTTQPTTAPARPNTAPAGEVVEPLDATPVLQKLRSANDPRAEDAFVGVASDLAWFELYYAKKPQAAARWIEALGAVLKPDSVILQRMQGWSALVAGKTQQAGEIFSKIAGRDALADLGLLRVDEAAKKPVDPATAQKLLDEHRTGLVGAMLWAALRSDANQPATRPAANDLAAEVEKFPKQWITALLNRRAYAIHGEPVQSGVPYGSPLLARVSIDNPTDFDLTVGSDSLLRPDLWFNAQVLGLDQQTLPNTAFDTIQGDIVVRAHSFTSQIVRLDEGILAKLLHQLPGASTRISAEALTNPITAHDPNSNQDLVMPGAGGTTGMFSRTFVYAGIPLSGPSGQKQLDDALASNLPADKLCALDVLASYIVSSRHPQASEAFRKGVAAFPGKIAALRKDPSPAVGAWAGYLSAGLATGAAQERIVTEMAASPDWATRLLSVFSAVSLPTARQKELASNLAAKDSDPTVKAAAAAVIEALDQAATQPSTRPASTQPTQAASDLIPPAAQ